MQASLQSRSAMAVTHPNSHLLSSLLGCARAILPHDWICSSRGYSQSCAVEFDLGIKGSGALGAAHACKMVDGSLETEIHHVSCMQLVLPRRRGTHVPAFTLHALADAAICSARPPGLLEVQDTVPNLDSL